MRDLLTADEGIRLPTVPVRARNVLPVRLQRSSISVTRWKRATVTTADVGIRHWTSQVSQLAPIDVARDYVRPVSDDCADAA